MNNKVSNNSNTRKLEKIKPWFEPIRLVFDFVVIVVMIYTLNSAIDSAKVAHHANELTRQTLQSNYVPWPKLILFNIERKNNGFTNLNFRFKNFSPTGPAINLTVRSLMPKISNENYSYSKDALMPGEEGTQSLTINSAENEATIDAIQNGQLPVRVQILCTDIFGTPYKIEEEFRKIDDKYRLVEYLPKGVLTSLDSTKQ